MRVSINKYINTKYYVLHNYYYIGNIEILKTKILVATTSSERHVSLTEIA